jgi:hypothetical protein
MAEKVTYVISVRQDTNQKLNPIIGLFIYSYNTQIWNNSIYNNYKHFSNTKDTTYGNRLPKGTAV